MLRCQFNQISFHNKLILRAGELKANLGSITVVKGASGSGKSTLAKVLSFQNEFVKDYLYNDKHIAYEQSQEFLYQHMSIVSQQPLFINDLTVKQHIRMLKELYGIKDSIKHWIVQLNLQKCIEKYPLELSGGERMRFACLLALIKNPDILILDEPTSSLDLVNTMCIIGVLKEYAKLGKIVIVFTHSRDVVEAADCLYEIKDSQLNCLKSSEIESLKESKIIEKNKKSIVKSLKLMKLHQKIYHTVIHVLTIIFLTIVSFSFDFNNKMVEVQNKQLSEMTSAEIIVYKPYAQNKNKFYNYNCTDIVMSNEEIESIKKLKYVQDVEWRYDESVDETGLDIETYGKHYSGNFNIKLLDGNKEIKNYQYETLQHLTYDKDHISTKDIEYYFQNEGVFISKQLAMNLSNGDMEMLQNKKLELDLKIPIYYEEGTRWVSWDHSEWISISQNDTVLKRVKIPIAGVLNNSSFGVYCDWPECLFIERGIYEKYINEMKPKELKTLYWLDEDHNEFTMVEPKNKQDIYEIFHYLEWQPNAYTVYLDSPAYVGEFLAELDNMGLAGCNGYVDYNSLLSSSYAMQKVFSSTSYAIGIVIVLIYFMILMMDRKTERKRNLFFRSIGLSKADVGKARSRYYINQIVINFAVVVGVMIVVQVVTNRLFLAGTEIGSKSILCALILTTVVYGLLPMLVNEMGDRNAKTR